MLRELTAESMKYESILIFIEKQNTFNEEKFEEKVEEQYQKIHFVYSFVIYKHLLLYAIVLFPLQSLGHPKVALGLTIKVKFEEPSWNPKL